METGRGCEPGGGSAQVRAAGKPLSPPGAPVLQEANLGADAVRGAGEPWRALRAAHAHLQGLGVHLQVHRPLQAPLRPVSTVQCQLLGMGLGGSGRGPTGSVHCGSNGGADHRPWGRGAGASTHLVLVWVLGVM